MILFRPVFSLVQLLTRFIPFSGSADIECYFTAVCGKQKMFSVSLLLMLCVSLNGLLSVDTGVISSEQAELRRYRYRVGILHQELLDLNCSDVPAILVRRQLLTDSHHTEHQLSVEKSLYYHLLDLMVTCKKSLLATTEKPQKSTDATSTPSSTTASTAVTTEAATTATSTTNTPSTTTQKMTCPQGYLLNPYSSTCIRLVEEKVYWSNAQSACEGAREKLAVFSTVDSIKWITGVMTDPKNPIGWRSGWYWIGLKYVDGEFRWQGRISGILSKSDPIWDNRQPDSSDACGCVEGHFNNYKKLHDCPCKQTFNYICEKI